MFNWQNVAILIAIGALQLSVPMFFVGRRLVRGELRIRYSVRGLLVFVTLLGVALGILCLPLPLLMRIVVLWGFAVCSAGFYTTTLLPNPRRKDKPP
ncbi:MAG TPA: hypothetical protein VHC22_05350 [Pirellulales bacterium]|nr:hypothetical protein [Pirellulales bacterium]